MRSNDESVMPAEVMGHLIRRECARADRSGQEFSLIVFRVGGSARHRESAARRLSRAMVQRGRLTDDVGWLEAGQLAALLPDTSAEGARAFAEGLAMMIARHGPRPEAKIYAYPHDRATMPALRVARRTRKMSDPTRVRAEDGGSNIGPSAVRSKRARRNPRPPQGRSLLADWVHTADSALADAVSSVALAEPRIRIFTENELSVANEALPTAPWNLPVSGLEELLAYPMPAWKRALDLIGAVLLLVLLFPVLAAAALAIKLSSPGPVLFLQRRSGLGGKPFTIFKFRTMCVDAEKRQQELRQFNEQDGPAFKLTRDPRVTRVGAFLRKTSIDELPQLWNVLKGDMSLVGPRPLPIKEQEGCEQWQRHRLNVTPGLTCIWQVKGRSQVSFADWVRMDVEYIRRRTILHDLTILFSTIPSVLLRRGAR